MIAPLFLALALHWSAQPSPVTANLRGLCVVSEKIVWASGAQGTFLLSLDAGLHWRAATVPGAEALDFRDVDAFDGATAYLLASGEGANSRVYKTTDSGIDWSLLFTNPDTHGFFDAIAFWDSEHGILLGDPVGGHFVIYTTADGGRTWRRRKAPPSLMDEGAFAASGTCLIAHGSRDVWFATGGPSGARVFTSHNRGRSWRAARTPLGGSKSSGIFSLAVAAPKRVVAVGGDYQTPNAAGQTVAISNDGGKTWTPATGLGYRSAVASIDRDKFIAVGTSGADTSENGGTAWRHFSDLNLNAVAASGKTVWAVGPGGVIALLANE